MPPNDEAARRRNAEEDEKLRPAVRADLERVLTAAGYEIVHGAIMADREKGRLRCYPLVSVSYDRARRLKA